LLFTNHNYSCALRFLFLQTHTTSYVFLQTQATQTYFYSKVIMYNVKEKGEKPYPLPYGLRNPYRNLKSENTQDYDQKPKQNCTFINSASVQDCADMSSEEV
jgi:hypothetical protein